MRRLRSIAVGTVAIILVASVGARHGGQISALSRSSILLAQARLTTDNQFVALYNNTDNTIALSTVQLAYFNQYDLSTTQSISSKYIPLSGSLPAHGFLMLSEGSVTVCYKMQVLTQSLGFSTKAGTLQILDGGPGGTVLDALAWNKVAATTSNPNPPASMLLKNGGQAWNTPVSSDGFLQRAWFSTMSGAPDDIWLPVTPAPTDVCALQTLAAPAASMSAPEVLPSVTTVAAQTASTLPPSNTGLVAPEITELLPNPAAPQTDDSDEFIELYNPNNAVFNLAGYRLEAGTTYAHGYTFEAGSLEPKSYTAFMITETKLQLSNSEGQVRLLDPDGNTISETPGYVDAPEGESWSLIADDWQWSASPSPGSANQAGANDSKTAGSKSASSKTSTGKVAGATTNTPNNVDDLNDATPLHPLVLAGVGVSAVAYACYEYRKDLANHLFRLRRYVRARRSSRARSPGR